MAQNSRQTCGKPHERFQIPHEQKSKSARVDLHIPHEQFESEKNLGFLPNSHEWFSAQKFPNSLSDSTRAVYQNCTSGFASQSQNLIPHPDTRASFLLGRVELRFQVRSVAQVGLISDEKLVDLLDLALSADTVNTVKNLREIMESGVEPLALMSQLATVITDILAGSYDLTKERPRRKFFRRQSLSKEDMEKLRQALKTLSEAEKQLRMSNDRLTWLTAAMLQLAPDQQYMLPSSSADTSFNHSPSVQRNSGRRERPRKSNVEHSEMLNTERGFPLHDTKIENLQAGSSSDAYHNAKMKGNTDRRKHAAAVMVPQQTFTLSADMNRTNSRLLSARVNKEIEDIWLEVLEKIQIKGIKDFLYQEGKLILVRFGAGSFKKTCGDSSQYLLHLYFVSNDLPHHLLKGVGSTSQGIWTFFVAFPRLPTLPRHLTSPRLIALKPGLLGYRMMPCDYILYTAWHFGQSCWKAQTVFINWLRFKRSPCLGSVEEPQEHLLPSIVSHSVGFPIYRNLKRKSSLVSAPIVQLMFSSHLTKSKAEKYKAHILLAFESVLGSPVTIEIRCEFRKDARAGVNTPLVLPGSQDGSSLMRTNAELTSGNRMTMLGYGDTSKRVPKERAGVSQAPDSLGQGRSEIVEINSPGGQKNNEHKDNNLQYDMKDLENPWIGEVEAPHKKSALTLPERRKLGEQNQSQSLVRGKVSLAHVIQQAEGSTQRNGWTKRKAVSIAEKLEQENLKLEPKSRSLLCWKASKVTRRKDMGSELDMGLDGFDSAIQAMEG
ncbi:hypothetical protein TEA_021551 [Camellia sinensis var. sinensis]|uniref:Uncharacterized protein n=1 Tax=Camellia sinensis var. sinensis TaxID=542762 RepID=A0A4S4ESU5_CAMSN|nr:hypothetical protein TEA_021551 [Camellia sinensis var. sinensis]